MKFFNKLFVFLIIASFIFSGDIFARNLDDVNNERRSIRKTLVRSKRAQIKRERPTRTTRTVTRKARPAIADRKKSALSNRRAVRSRRAAQTSTPNRKQTVRTTRARTQRTEPNPVRYSRKSKVAAPVYYTVNPNDIPEDLKNDLKFLGASLEKFSGKTTPEECRVALSRLQDEENKFHGFTQKTRNVFVSHGYNPGSVGNFDINTGTFTEEQKQFLRGAFNITHSDPIYTVENAQATNFLHRLQNIENHFVGITQRVREFLRAKYGFQG